jgi:hypothetical protein
MATRQRDAQIQEAELVQEPEFSLQMLNNLAPEPEPDDIAFSNLLADIGASDESGRVHVYKLERGIFKDQTFLFDCSPAEFNMTMLQDPQYHEDGFHDFRIVARNRTGIATAKTLKAMPRKDFRTASLSPLPALTPESIASAIVPALAQMQENTNKLIAALMQQNQQPQRSTMDMLQEMALMKQVLGGDAQRTDPMEMVRTALSLAKEINPPEGGSGSMDVLMKMLETFGKPIVESVAAMQSAPQPVQRVAPPPAHSIRVANPLPLEPTVQPQPAEEIENMSFMLKQALGFLSRQAETDADPSLYAELVLDQVGPDVGQYINSPEWFDMLTALQPKVATQRPWFEKLREEIKKLLTDDTDSITTAQNLGNLSDEPDNSDNEHSSRDTAR